MKVIFFSLIFFFFTDSSFCIKLYAQDSIPDYFIKSETLPLQSEIKGNNVKDRPRTFGFGHLENSNHGNGEFQCVDPEQREMIWLHIYNNIDSLKIIPNKMDGKSGSSSFILPIQTDPYLGWNNTFGVSNYVDMDPSSGILDYNCGSMTYDGHKGIDYFTWPFRFYLMENNYVHALAATSGTIIGKDDGHFSYNCTWGNQPWNAVYLLHDDGTVGWYGHLKDGTLTNVNNG